MKRILLALSIIATISSMAATTGSMEFKLKNTNTYDMYEKDKKNFRKVENKLDEVKLLTNVKVKDTGLSFGTELKGKDILVPLNDKSNVKGNILDNSSIFTKYEFSKSYVGATVKKEDISLNGGVSTKIDNTTYGADFVQVIPYKLDRNKTYLTSKLYLTNDNVDASLEVKNNYGKYKEGNYTNNALGKGVVFSPIEHINLKVDANKKINNSKIYFNSDVRYLFNENLVEYTNYLTGEDDVFRTWTNNNAANHKIYQLYKLGVIHNIKDVELNAELFGQNAMKYEINGYNGSKKELNDLPRVVAYFGTKLGVKYKATDNLVLSAKTTVGGTYSKKVEYQKNGSNGVDITKIKEYKILAGYVDLELGTKYNYKPTDKFTITPEFNAKASFDNLNLSDKLYEYATKTKTLLQLNLEPKLSMKYIPINNFSVDASVALPITFSNKAYINGKIKYDQPSGKKYTTDKLSDFRFNSVIPKVEMNIKYMW